MRRLGELIIASIFGAGVALYIERRRTNKRFVSYEGRLSTIENQVCRVENNILEFNETYQENISQILYKFRLLEREIEKLMQSSIPLKRKKELNDWLDFLRNVTTEKIQQKQQISTTPSIYIT